MEIQRRMSIEAKSERRLRMKYTYERIHNDFDGRDKTNSILVNLAELEPDPCPMTESRE